MTQKIQLVEVMDNLKDMSGRRQIMNGVSNKMMTTGPENLSDDDQEVQLSSNQLHPQLKYGTRRTSLILLILVLLHCCIVAITPVAGVRLANPTGSSAALMPLESTRHDDAKWDIHMSSEERAYRAIHDVGGEVSYCCCYCGRENSLSSHDEPGADGPIDDEPQPSDDWLYKPLPFQPRPEAGDPVDRLQKRRRHQQSKDVLLTHDQPYGALDSPGVAQFILFQTVQQRCDNEYCIDQSTICLKNHLWTGWAGLITGPSNPPPDAVRARCQEIYQKEMNVLDDFNQMIEHPENAQEQQKMVP